MMFEFNRFSALLLPAVVQGLLFSILHFRNYSRQRQWHELFIGLLLLVLSLRVSYWMLGFAGWYDSHDGRTSFMFYFPFENLFLLGPLMYFYLLSLTNADFRFQRRHWPHLVLPALTLAFSLLKTFVDFAFYYPFPDTEMTQFGTKGPWADLDRKEVFYLLGHAVFFFYTWLTIRDYQRYRTFIAQQYSFSDAIEFGWLRNVLYAIGAGVLVLFLFQVMSYFREGPDYAFTWYAYLWLGATVYYISIASWNTPLRFQQKLKFEPDNEPDEPGAKESKMPELDISAWKSPLLALLEQKQVYLNPELSLSDLAATMGTNTSVLSRVINTGFGMNFNDLINQYRVEAVVAQLKKGVHLRQTLLSIAFDCGFNSKATFNRAFKKLLNQTPVEFLESLKKNDA
jgi:AraC-like DNA-binding protein